MNLVLDHDGETFRLRATSGRHVDETRRSDPFAVWARRLSAPEWRPKHRAEEPQTAFDAVMSDLELEVPEEPRLDLARFLIVEQGWPSNAFTAHAVALFAEAVHRRYIAARRHEPEWDRGWVYRGFTDWLIIRDTYEEEMGALAERLAFEGVRS